MPIDWEDDYCDAGHVIKTLECGECAAARAEKAEADLKEALEALRALGTEHGCEPGSTPEEDRLLMCSVCRKALALCDKHPEGTKGAGK